MTRQEQQEYNDLNDRAVELQEAIVQAVAEIDQTDSSRIGLQETLDTVRDTLGTAYGDDLTADVNEYLGNETVDGEEVDEDEDDE